MLLERYRVLDLTDEKGHLCGRMLGDLGADVIKIEKPGGDPARNKGPFYHDQPHPEKSLPWWSYNANKRGITLDIESKDGQELLRKLVKTSHCFIESSPPSYLDNLGLDYSALSTVNPSLVYVSVTPFGLDGPWKNYQAPDLIGAALGGMMIWTGEPDKYPLRMSIEQSYLHAGSEAAAAAVIALYHAEMTGKGQQIDVSMLESWMSSIAHPLVNWEFSKTIIQREGKYRSPEGVKGVRIRNMWECKDGYVFTRLYGGKMGLKTNEGFAGWMKEEGVPNTIWAEIDWNTFDLSTVSQETVDKIQEQLARFLKNKTKDELFQRAVDGGMQVAPAYDPEDLAKNHQLLYRKFWQEVEHPELHEKILYAGSFAIISGESLGIRRRAPLIGEHNLELYTEIGLSREEIIALKQAGVL